MKKKYLSPKFEFLKIDLIEDVLNVSDMGGSASGGGGETLPFNDPNEMNQPDIF